MDKTVPLSGFYFYLIFPFQFENSSIGCCLSLVSRSLIETSWPRQLIAFEWRAEWHTVSSDTRKMEFIFLFTLAAVVRIALIIYGWLQDLYLKVKYTDIDYIVFSDAAKHVVNGSSPYNRATYRYTPLLAFLMTPNTFIHPSFGKVFFSICDLIVGWLIIKLIRSSFEQHSIFNEDVGKQSIVKQSSLLAAAAWLFNPLSLAISTRGNAESVQAVLVLATLLSVMRNYHFIGGLFFGFAVHFKIYPVIYSLPIFLYISRDVHKTLLKNWKCIKLMDIVKTSTHQVKDLFSFASAASSVLLATTYLFYSWLVSFTM